MNVRLEPVVLGRLSGLYGVRGAFKVFSGTEPREAICDYPDWLVRHRGEWQSRRLIEGRRHGRTVVARIDGVDDRNVAATMLGSDIAVRREALPRLAAGEYYWADLIGLDVITGDGVNLGHVQRLFTTGANDVMVIAGERERWLPFLRDNVVRDVDLTAGVMVVDWDPDF